jgi:hypothetical protein
MPGPEVGKIRRAAVALVADEEGGGEAPVRIGVEAGSLREAVEGVCRQRRNTQAGRLDVDKFSTHIEST